MMKAPIVNTTQDNKIVRTRPKKSAKAPAIKDDKAAIPTVPETTNSTQTEERLKYVLRDNMAPDTIPVSYPKRNPLRVAQPVRIYKKQFALVFVDFSKIGRLSSMMLGHSTINSNFNKLE